MRGSSIWWCLSNEWGKGWSIGVQAHFRVKHPQAVHCYGHELNLVLCHMCKAIPEATEFFELLESIYSFFHVSRPSWQVCWCPETFGVGQQWTHSVIKDPVGMSSAICEGHAQQLSCCEAVIREHSYSSSCRTPVQAMQIHHSLHACYV